MRRLALACVLLGVFGVALPQAHAQGCSQCREAVGQTPARVQTAYRRGIVLLVVAAGTVFTGAIVVLKRFG